MLNAFEQPKLPIQDVQTDITTQTERHLKLARFPGISEVVVVRKTETLEEVWADLYPGMWHPNTAARSIDNNNDLIG